MSDPELELHRWRQAFREVGDRPPGEGTPAEETLDPETLAALATGELGGAERAAAADRVLSDPRALADYRTLVELHREAAGPIEKTPGPIEETPEPALGTRPGWRRWGGVAAAAAALAIAVLWLVRPPGEGPAAVDPAPVTRGAEPAVVPASGAELRAAPELLLWPGQPGATAYRPTLFDADGRELWAGAASSEPRAALPAGVAAELSAGGGYLWTVEVEGPVQRRRLGPFHFRIAAAE